MRIGTQGGVSRDETSVKGTIRPPAPAAMSPYHTLTSATPRRVWPRVDVAGPGGDGREDAEDAGATRLPALHLDHLPVAHRARHPVAHHEQVVALGAQVADHLAQVALAAERGAAPGAVDGEGLAAPRPARPGTRRGRRPAAAAVNRFTNDMGDRPTPPPPAGSAENVALPHALRHPGELAPDVVAGTGPGPRPRSPRSRSASGRSPRPGSAARRSALDLASL